MLDPWAVWLIVVVLLIIAEMLTLTYYLLWIATGALAAGIVSLALPESFAVQGLIGGGVAILLTVLMKPFTKRMQNSKGFKDAIDELIGSQGIVLNDIEEGKPGIVKVGSDTWSAVSKEALKQGDIVEVIHRGSTLLEVKKWGG